MCWHEVSKEPPFAGLASPGATQTGKCLRHRLRSENAVSVNGAKQVQVQCREVDMTLVPMSVCFRADR